MSSTNDGGLIRAWGRIFPSANPPRFRIQVLTARVPSSYAQTTQKPSRKRPHSLVDETEAVKSRFAITIKILQAIPVAPYDRYICSLVDVTRLQFSRLPELIVTQPTAFLWQEQHGTPLSLLSFLHLCS
jgi:hypothetical protein